jgi:regulator of extracellular matrix RemA (YlzA/DUF370 family)
METRLVKLKNDFNSIITIRNNVKNIFDILLVKIDKLKLFYAELVKDKRNNTFVFGLDSFYFQSKLIDIEYDDMKRFFLAINNRMYCEYFKLHKIINEYICKNITDKKIIEIVKSNSYPVYKDLEPFKEYDIEIILDIHENILNLLGILISTLNNRENELEIHKTKQNIGLNIDNFITTFSFHITVLREKIIMFITYIEFFHKLHAKYLKRFNTKIQLMHTNIINDINFDESVEMNNYKKEELFNEFNINGADQDFLKSLKKTINSEASSENGDINDTNDNQIKDSKDNNIILVINEEIKNKELVIDNLAVKKDDEICIDDNESVSNSVIEDEQVTNKPVIEEKKKRTYKPRKK